MSFFKSLDTKLKTVIICNKGCPMFKTDHIALIFFKEALHLQKHWFKIQIYYEIS